MARLSSSPRRRCCAAAALLMCATLVLVAACASDLSSFFRGDLTVSGYTFNGDSVTFDLGSSHTDVAKMQLTNSRVLAKGLAFHGYSGTVPSGVTTRVSMSVASTTVDGGTISFTGVMPTNSDVRFTATTGTLAAAQSLFDFSGLKLSGNVTVTVEDSSVTWPSSGTNTGSVVAYSAGSTGAGIDGHSALFIINATATNGASVLHIDTPPVFCLTNNAVLSVDQGRCNGCSSTMVDIDVPLQADGSSMFRVTRSTFEHGNFNFPPYAGNEPNTDGSQCQPVTTTTTTTTTTAPCNVEHCSRCDPSDSSTCATCGTGYKIAGRSCIANSNAATPAQSALLAAVVCAVAVYML